MKALIPLLLLAFLAACLALTDPFGQGEASVTSLLSLRCADARPIGLDPETGTLWLESDSLVPDSLVVQFAGVVTRRPIQCTVDTTPLPSLPGMPSIDGIHAINDSTYSVVLTGRERGRIRAAVTLNTATVFALDLLTASRRFAASAWGHTGAGSRVPENTLLAVQTAVVAGLAGSEVDVRLTRDTVPVLMHDETVDRTTNGSGRVESFTAAEITALDAGVRRAPQFAGEHVPTLLAAVEMAVVSQHHLLLDVKDQRIIPVGDEARLLVDLVRSVDAESLVTLLSPSPTFLRAARQASPGIALALLAPVYRSTHRALAASLGVDALLYAVPDSLLSPAVIAGLDSLSQAGFDVIASTTNRPTLADSLIALTPIRTILTDFPPRVYRLRTITRY